MVKNVPAPKTIHHTKASIMLRCLFCLLCALPILSATRSANAGITISFTQQSGYVDEVLSGEVNTAAFNFAGTFTYSSDHLFVGDAFYTIENVMGTPTGNLYQVAFTSDPYFGVTQFTSESFATTSTGNSFVYYRDVHIGYIGVPSGYQSGNTLHAEETYVGQTFASMNLNPGDYLTTWGSGANADFLDIRIGQQAPAVPEPSTLLLFGTAFSGLGFYGWRRRNLPGLA